MIGLQIIISSFDLLAIVLLGVLSSAGLGYVQSGNDDLPNWISEVFNVGAYNFEKQFVLLAIFIFFLFSGRTFLSIYGNKRILLFLGERGSFASNSLLAKVFESRPGYIVNKKSQEILYGITTGIDNLVLNYLGAIAILLSECFFLISIATIIIILEPLTGISAFAVFSISFWLIHNSTSGKSKEYAEELGALTISYNQKLLEKIYVYRELFLRKHTFIATREIRERRRRSLMIRAQLLFLPVISKYLFEFVLIIGSAVVALAQLAVSDAFSAISSLVVFLAAASRILPSLIRAQGSFLSIKQSEGMAMVTIQQLEELEDTSNVVDKSSNEDVDLVFTPIIETRDLHFAYSKDSKFSMSNISLNINPGTFVAVVGESGSGKTTLIDLLLGMLEPKSGVVKISGLNPVSAAKKWPGKIAYVPQNIVILDGSIRENITLDDELSNSEKDIEKALEKSKLLDEVESLPNKFDEIVGESGFKLSGGQRQRLGIARALYTKPELIIFDEATSALDSVTEKTVTDAIYDRAKGVTLIVIAHRLSTVRNADLVLYLENGQLIAQGTFEEVRKLAPKFDEQAKLVNL